MKKSIEIAFVFISLLTLFIVVSEMDENDAVGTTEIDGEYYAHVVDADTKDYSDNILNIKRLYVDCETIGAGAFADCDRLQKVIFSDKVKYVSDGAFSGCTSIKLLKMPNVVTIGNNAFEGCTSLSNITVSSSLKTIGDNAFKNCTSISKSLIAGTSVTSIGSCAFANTKIATECLYTVTSLADDAYSGCPLKAVIVKKGNEINGLINIVTESNFIQQITCSESNIILSVSGKNNLFGVDSNGNRLLATFSNSSGVCNYTFDIQSAGNYYFSNKSFVLHFQEFTGLKDITVTPNGKGYTLPNGNDIGDLVFKNWYIDDVDGPLKSITYDYFSKTDSLDIYLIAEYSKTTLTMDNSGITVYYPDTALDTSLEYTIGDKYPALKDVGDFKFVGWLVDGKMVSGGEEIKTYTAHVAKSVWMTDVEYNVDVIGFLGASLTSFKVLSHETVSLDDLDPQCPKGYNFLYWTINGKKLDSDPMVKNDITIVAMFEEKAKYTLTYIVDGSVYKEVVTYEDEPFTIDASEPVKNWVKFKCWMLDENTTYNTGDSISIHCDTELNAIWNDPEKFTLSYHLIGETVSEQYDAGTTITIKQKDSRSGYEFKGWNTVEDSNEAKYMYGQEIIIAGNVDLYPVWEKIAEKEDPVTPVVDPEEKKEDDPETPVVDPEKKDEPVTPIVDPEDDPVTPVVDPEKKEEDKPVTPVVDPEKKDDPVVPIIDPKKEEDEPVTPVVDPEDDPVTPVVDPEKKEEDEPVTPVVDPEEDDPVVPIIIDPVVPPVEPVVDPTDEGSSSNNKSNNTGLIIGAAIGAILTITLAIVYLRRN